MPDWFIDKRDNDIDPMTIHASEWAWIDKDNAFEQIIQNDGSLDELQHTVEKIINY